MATNFPTSLDTLTNPTSSNKLSDVGVLHTDQHANANDAIEALQAKVGINGSAVTSSLDYKVTNAAPKASPTFTGTVTLPLTTAGYVTTTSGGVIGSVATIPNAGLTNSSITVNGTAIALGSTGTITVPISTGVSGLGTGIATFLATPTSANLATALTDESGSTSVVFSASPTFTGTPLAPTAAVDTNTTQIATTAYVIGQSYLKTTTASSTYAALSGSTFTGATTLAAGTASVAPLILQSGTNLTTAAAGRVEFDGTVLNFTPNTNFGRASLQPTVFTSGTGISLTPTATGEATAQPLFPAANDTITLPIGTYYIQIKTTVTRGATSTTSATARINLAGGGTAVGSFSGDAISSIAAGGTTSQFAFNGVALTVDNVVSAANTTAAGVYNINLSGILRITTAGTFIPKYSLSAALTGATTATSPSSSTFMKIDILSSSGSAASTGAWA